MNNRQKKVLGLALGLLPIVFFSQLGLSKVVFEVKKLKGEVRVSYPGDFHFKKLSPKEKYLFSGALVEVMQGAGLEIEQFQIARLTPLTKGRKIAKIRLNLPSVLRLNEDTLRTYRTKPYPIKTLLSSTKKEAKPVRKKPVLDLMNAFQRSMVELTNPDYVPKLLVDPEVKAVDTAVKVEPLEIYMPANDSLHYVRAGFAGIPVLWEKRPDIAPFYIYLWKEGEAKGEPYVQSDSNSQYVRIDKPGSYYLQVVSEDRKYRSKRVRISVDPERFTSGKWNYPKDFLERRTPKARIVLQQPKNGLVFISEVPKNYITFKWNDQDQRPSYRLQVLREGEVVVDEITSESSFFTSLREGDYSWVVNRVQDTVAAGLTSRSGSKPKKFTIQKVKSANSREYEKIVSELFKSSEDRTYYWDF